MLLLYDTLAKHVRSPKLRQYGPHLSYAIVPAIFLALFSNSFIDHLGSNKHSLTMTAVPKPVPVSATNGYTNGHSSVDIDEHTTIHNTINESSFVQTKRHEESLASRTETRSMTATSHAHTFTNHQQVTVLRQTVISTRSRLISELSHVDAHYIDSMTVESFLKYTERQRLIHMPRRGSRWDRVLTRAEFFALQISRYEKAVHSFVPDSKNAAKMIWAAARVLIEVSPTIGNPNLLDNVYNLLPTREDNSPFRTQLTYNS